SAFIVPKGTPGFRVVERIPCIGLRGHQDEEVELKDCRIPKGNLIGEEGKGLKYALSTLDRTRTSLTGGFIGLARAALEEAVKFARARKAFGQPIADFQAISFP
ncbi:MAG: acyl-CoA dehydrogenase, partial [Chloroflexi bacterium CG08_land_8_20_14_0_20_45_12]